MYARAIPGAAFVVDEPAAGGMGDGGGEAAGGTRTDEEKKRVKSDERFELGGRLCAVVCTKVSGGTVNLPDARALCATRTLFRSFR